MLGGLTRQSARPTTPNQLQTSANLPVLQRFKPSQHAVNRQPQTTSDAAGGGAARMMRDSRA
jgi:hypothetical protein